MGKFLASRAKRKNGERFSFCLNKVTKNIIDEISKVTRSLRLFITSKLMDSLLMVSSMGVTNDCYNFRPKIIIYAVASSFTNINSHKI